MGGVFSGRWEGHEKQRTVEQTLVLSVTAFKDAIERVSQTGRALSICVDGPQLRPEHGLLAAVVVPRAASPAVQICRVTTVQGGNPIVRCNDLSVTCTTPNFGGRRWWWQCPGRTGDLQCKRRVQKLYLPTSFVGQTGGVFACRHCHDLTYTSCQESHQGERMLASVLAEISRRFPDVEVGPLRRPLNIKRGSLRPEELDEIERIFLPRRRPPDDHGSN
jgi:hypothetical protein